MYTTRSSWPSSKYSSPGATTLKELRPQLTSSQTTRTTNTSRLPKPLKRQAHWSEYLSQFNLVIHFHPGKLGTKPDPLTRQWDVYPKEGERSYAAVKPHNFRPVFTNEQLASSLQATVLYAPVLQATVLYAPVLQATTIMDLKALHSDIRSVLHSDPAISEQLSNPTL